MRILPVTNYKANNSKNNNNKNVNFGVNLYVENRVPRFVYKNAADRAFRLGQDAQRVMNETYAATVNFFRMLSERVKPLEPAELPVLLELTPQANKYVDDAVMSDSTMAVDGREYPENLDAFRLRAQSPFSGQMLKDYEKFDLNEEGMQKFEKEIKIFADIYDEYRPKF